MQALMQQVPRRKNLSHLFNNNQLKKKQICHTDKIGILSIIDRKKGIARPTSAYNLFCVTSSITVGNLRYSACRQDAND